MKLRRLAVVMLVGTGLVAQAQETPPAVEPAAASDDEEEEDEAAEAEEAAEEPPADADAAASDMTDDLGAAEEAPPAEEPAPVPDVLDSDPEATELVEERTLERQVIRYHLLPPVERPVEDSRRVVDVRPRPRLGVTVHEELGTSPVERAYQRSRAEDERLALGKMLRSIWTPPRVTSGPLGPIRGDIPLADNDMVQRWIKFFQGVGAQYYRKWMARYWRYGPVMRQILESEGVPSDLVFLSMIESGFSPKAYSFAHAAGPWQFIRPTGTRMGLEVNFWVDERRDPIKSTYAAARYLKELFRTWNDWHLAWASYNAGPGKVNRAVKRHRSRDFFVLARGRYLRWETKNYVPKLIAAATIGQNPAAYGFGDVEPLPLFEFDTMLVADSMAVASLAKACGVALEVLQELNPELRRPMTPPRSEGEPAYELRIPKGAGLACRDGLERLTEPERMRYRRIRVRPNDTLDAIAKRFHTTTAAIVAENSLPNTQLRQGEDLIIPVPPGPVVPIGDLTDDVRERRGRVAKAPQPRGTRAVRVTVKKGDTLWEIAQKHGVDVRSVAAWNGLNRRRRLRIGQRLVVYVKDGRAR